MLREDYLWQPCLVQRTVYGSHDWSEDWFKETISGTGKMIYKYWPRFCTGLSQFSAKTGSVFIYLSQFSAKMGSVFIYHFSCVGWQTEIYGEISPLLLQNKLSIIVYHVHPLRRCTSYMFLNQFEWCIIIIGMFILWKYCTLEAN